MKNVLFLDDDKNLCHLMAELLEENPDIHVETVNSFEEFQALGPGIGKFDTIFLDFNLGPGVPTGLDAYNWLKTQHFEKKIVFFTGHAQAYPLVRDAGKSRNVFVLEKPAPIHSIEKFVTG